MKDHWKDSLGVFTGDKAQEVRIRFDAFAAQLVREREWHPSQKLKELDNSELELTLKLGSLPEIFRWVLSWGEHAKVVSPPSLREQIQQTAARLVAAYAS